MTITRFRSVPLARPSRLLLLLLFAALCGLPPRVRAASLPTGGSVAAGTASIGTAGNKSLTVTQSSSSAVLNWQSFSVAQGYAVKFVQPSSTSAILNRVTGSTPSTIAGSISANGQVYLVNPNGIAITSTGTVNAAAFVASTLAISDDDFMAGKRVFTGSGASAAVSNAGIITIGRGGYAALLGGSVDHTGTITVPLGKVGLGSGEQATLDLSGDGFLQVAIPTTASGSGALVSNSGTISADGGLIQLSAAAAKDLARQAINMSGTIEAKSVGGTSGNIVLAGSDGAVEVSGTLDATSDAAGGAITITGRDITLSGASLDASGATGGGTIRVGGGRQGSGTLQHADTLTVDSASTIKADAISTGDGGDVVLWSDQLTTFAGTISARGGAISGDGGQAEVSGKALLSYTGLTDLSAANGAFGTLLLDPYNVTISDGSDSNYDLSTYTATGESSVINATTLTNQLARSNVTVTTGGSGSAGSQAGNITVSAPLTWSSGSMLTLSAANSIAVNANITVAGGGKLALNYAGDLTFGNGASASFASGQTGQSLSINNVSYTLLYSMADIDHIDTTGLAGHYALATSLTAPVTPYTDALVAGGDGSTSFTGTFEGLGHTITGLTIDKTDDPGGGFYAGLFGVIGTGGVVRDIGLIGASVRGVEVVGSLAGKNDGGTITNVYAIGGSVSGSKKWVGGLVGWNAGAISNAYVTSAVSANKNDGDYTGGLVGYNDGKIVNAYATGAVSGGDDVGGLVGTNWGTISNVYATGAVTGTTIYVGGLVGFNYSTITSAYWDTKTSGRTKGIGYDNNGQTVTGLTTAQFQTLAAATNLGSAFCGDAGLYPYLTSFFPSGVQAVSGIAYKTGTTLLKSGSSGAGLVYVRLGDGSVITVTTGANGYYYAFAANGSIASSGTGVLAYTVAGTGAGATDAATYTTRATGSLSGFNVYGKALTETADSGVTTLSALDTAYTAATQGTTAASLSLTNRTISAQAANFTIDTLLTASGAVTVTTANDLTIGNSGTLRAGTSATLSAAGAFVNNRGSDAVKVTSGRWLIYSADSDGDTFGSLDSTNTAIWNIAAGATISATGNRYVFAAKPTVTVTTTNASKTYGDVANVAANYTLSGAVNGVAGAYLGIADASILSGALSSTGATVTANVGNYGYTLGTLSVASGYLISLVNTGMLTVSARPITVAAGAATSVYGDTPNLTYSVSGLVNGDTLSGSLASATRASDVGTYAITLGSLGNSNYSITSYTGNTLTISARPITVTADSQNRSFGAANPLLSYSIGGLGLVNGDTLSGALTTSARATSRFGTYAITQGSLAASANYAMTFVPGLLTVTALATADSSTRAPVVARSWTVNNDWAVPAAPTSPLELSFGSRGTVIFSSPSFDSVLTCGAGGRCAFDRFTTPGSRR